MTARVAWESSFRIVAAHLPRIDIFEQVAEARDLPALFALEALTNPRLQEIERALGTVPSADRVSGPGSTFVMAPFAYPRPSRFTDGTFGIYYAGESIETAIAEHTFHRALFLADTAEPPGVFDHRVIDAAIDGAFEDVARAANAAALLRLDDYTVSQRYGSALHARGGEGLVWPSVRRAGGTCVGALKPRAIRNARSAYYLGYRWNGAAIDEVHRMDSLTGSYPAEPGLH